MQRLQCDGAATHAFEGFFEPRDCGNQVWTGAWPGDAECAELGWHSFWEHPGRGWVVCGPGHPQAGPDLNRLCIETEWDPLACRWRRRGDPVDDTFYVHWHLEIRCVHSLAPLDAVKGYVIQPRGNTALHDGGHQRLRVQPGRAGPRRVRQLTAVRLVKGKHD
jgi:hypothetical protein